MKRRVFALLLVMTLAMGGCGKDAKDTDRTGENTEQTGNAEPQESVPEQEPKRERVHLKDIDVEAYLTLEGDYIGLALTIPPREEVTDEDVVAIALEPYNTYVTVETGVTDRAAVLGDIVNIDYSGKKDGVAFDGGTAQAQDLELGSGSFIPGFEDGLVGVMPGETVDLNLTFPENYRNEELAGAEVVFTVTVNFIYPSTKEEMQDGLVEEMTGGDYTTVDAFLEYAREYLEGEADYYYTVDKENAVLDALEAIAVFSELPEELVADYEYTLKNALEEQALYYYGLDVETFCTYFFGMDAATYVREAAESSTKQGMIFQYIAIKENLFLTDEEFETSMQEFAEENGYSSAEELLGDTDIEDFREYFLFEKVVDFIVEHGQVTEG